MRVRVSASILSPHGSEKIEFEAEVNWLTDIPEFPTIPEDSYLNLVVSLFYEVMPNLRLVDN